MSLSEFPRVRLAHLPTPLEPLDCLSAELGGPRIFVKRDDCTGLAFGGNKTRKLEFLLADARKAGADTVITAGGLQSNHVRQSAAAANRLGLTCHLVLQRYVEWPDDAYLESGNLLLDGLLGAKVHVVPPGAPRAQEMERLAERLRSEGKTPYVIPAGGSNALGGLGYALAAGEILDQAETLGIEVGSVVFSTASGGTQGGRIAGFARRHAAVEVIGINVDVRDAELADKVAAVAHGTADLLGLGDLGVAREIEIVDDYGGDSYGLPTPEMRETVSLLAHLEGLVLDPVYTGKAMAGLCGLVYQGRFDAGRAVVFVHTGGLPGLFAYPSLFPPDLPAGI
jgi:D-cysteine desulfhydrase family pyridoxal phosphate-dependent enzyme